jgi:CheY-like chemotaxis protein
MAATTVRMVGQGDAASMSERADSGGIDILIVDDELIVRRILEMALRPFGLRVRTAASGAEAVQLYYRHRGDVGLVVLDVQMPEGDGPRTLQALREIDSGVRAIFISGGLGEYSVEELLALGALDFIEKPFRNLTQLAARLEKLAMAPVAQLR